MKLFNQLQIRGKLIACFGVAMVIVLSALGVVTYLTFADAVSGAQVRIAMLHAQAVRSAIQAQPQALEEAMSAAANPATSTVGATDLSERWRESLRALQVPESVAVVLVPRQGRAVFLQASDLPVAAWPAWQAAWLSTTGPMARVTQVGGHYVHAQQVSDRPWMLYYAVPQEVFLADVMALKNRIIAATVIVLWISVWIVLIIAHRLSLPVRTLSMVMSTADQSLETTPAALLQRGDELGELARAFDSLRARLRSLINVDPLTQLYNRRFASQALRRHLMKETPSGLEGLRGRQPNSRMVCLMMDVDYFKSVNDSWGHPCGDQALVHCASVIRAQVRPSDVVARHGGEEFLVLLPDTDLETALQRAEVIRQRLESSPLRWDGHVLPLTVSVGVGWWTGDLQGLSQHSIDLAQEQLIEQADQALYEAKRQGRNRVVWRDERGQFTVVQVPVRPAQPTRAVQPSEPSVLRPVSAGGEADDPVERAVTQHGCQQRHTAEPTDHTL